MPAAAAASIVSGESTATVIRAINWHAAIRARRSGSSVSLASSRSSPTPASAMPTTSRGVAQVNDRWPDGHLRRGQRRALVRLDVRPQRGARAGGGHRRQVVVEHVDVDQQRRRRQVVDVPGHPSSLPRSTSTSRSRPRSSARSRASSARRRSAKPLTSNGRSPAACARRVEQSAARGCAMRTLTPSASSPAEAGQVDAVHADDDRRVGGGRARRRSARRPRGGGRPTSACRGMPRSSCSRAHLVPGPVPAPMPSVSRPPLIRCTLLGGERQQRRMAVVRRWPRACRGRSSTSPRRARRAA